MQRNYISGRIAHLCMVIISLSIGLLVAGASAETVLDPGLVSVESVSYNFIESTYWDASYTVDGRGMGGTGLDTWHTSAGLVEPGYNWVNRPNITTAVKGGNARPSPVNQWICYDLGAPRELDQIRVWQHGWYYMNQMGYTWDYAYIQTSLDNSSFTDLWHGNIPLGNTVDNDNLQLPADLIVDAGGVSARYVYLTAITNQNGFTAESYGGLGEVQFVTEADPPPPPPPPPSGLDLDITVGAPTQLSTLQNQNTNRLAVSRTDVVAAFYPKPGTGAKYSRTSTDGGLTWSSESSTRRDPGNSSVGLAGGGVVSVWRFARPVGGGNPPVATDLESDRVLYSDDFSSSTSSTVPVTIPNAVEHTLYADFWPCWEKGKIIELANGDLLAPIYGNLQGDNNVYRTMLMESPDQGQSWQYKSTIAYSATDPDPGLPGGFAGYCEPSITQLANGQLLAMLRTQASHIGPDYRPMYTAWSDDLGLTWTEPEPTDLPLLNVWPTLITLDNGVVACVYGRPGVHVAFSTDHGHTWSDIETFSTLPTTGLPGTITGYADMVQAGPNDLVVIAGIEGGTYVWPISVDLAGDVDGDGFVGGDDLTIILTNWGSSGMTREQGDLTGEGFVGGDDYTEVLTYWGTGIGLGAVLASVPEPVSLTLLSAAALALAAARRRRCRYPQSR